MIKDDMQNYDNKLPKLKQLEQKLTNMYPATNLLNTISSYGKEENKGRRKSRKFQITV